MLYQPALFVIYSVSRRENKTGMRIVSKCAECVEQCA